MEGSNTADLLRREASLKLPLGSNKADDTPAIHLTLTPSNNPSDRRKLSVSRDQIVTIGRASKSEAKNLSATEDNALFDCPVVSRAHAQLRAASWSERDKVVEIIDKHSMHGTSVNGQRLTPGIAFTLKGGDLIKLGDTVTRGPDTHDGVLVTFALDSRQEDEPEDERQGNRQGYHVPSGSDEESGQQSDIDSVLSDDEPLYLSSAKTTPEQSKPKLGSQEKPIDLDGNHRISHPVINLVDDDDEGSAIPSSNPARQSSSSSSSFESGGNMTRTIIQDTYDEPRRDEKGPTIYEFFGSRRPEQKAVIQDTYEEFSDDENVADHDTGLSQMLHSDARGGESDAVDDIDSDNESYELQRAVDDEYLSDSDASDLSDHEQPMDMSDEEGPEEVSSRPQPSRGHSPELGSTREQNTTFSASYASLDRAPTTTGDTTLKPRYDPVRGSNPPTQPSFIDASAGSHVSARPISSFTFAPYDHPEEPYYDTSYPPTTASRWDMPPKAASSIAVHPPKVPQMPTYWSNRPLPGYKLWDSGLAQETTSEWGNDNLEPSATAHYVAQHDHYIYDEWSKNKDRQAASSTSSQQQPPFEPASAANSQQASQIPPPFSTAKTQMSIPNLVDDAHHQPTEKVSDKSSTKSSKRKAAEISADALDASGKSEVINSIVSTTPQWNDLFRAVGSSSNQPSTAGAALAVTVNEVRAPKRVKTNVSYTKTKRLMWEGTKLGAAAVTGGMGVVAFLLSPLADRALEWASSV